MKRKKKIQAIENEDMPELSYEELALMRAQQEKREDRSRLTPHDTSEKAKLFRFVRKNKIVTAAAMIIVLALLAGVGFGVYSLISLWVNRPNTSAFTVELGEEEPYSVPYDEAVRDGVLYVDLRKIATFADLIVSGSQEHMQFTAKTGSFLRFEHQSEFARINGKRVEMLVSEFRSDGEKEISAKAILTADACYVPYLFLKDTVMEGMQFRFNNETNTISLRRTFTDELDEEDQPIVKQLFFDTNHFAVLSEEGIVEHEYLYSIDIEPYLESITAENLLLANKQNPLGEDFSPRLEQITVKTASNRILYLNADAVKALEAMFAEMMAAGVNDVMVTSAYRSYARQYELFFKTYYNQEKREHPSWTDDQIYAEVLTYSAYPGTSEHQTGLCVDFITSTMTDLDNTFEATRAFEWLSQNAYKFGYILRYDKDKVDITGYSYESWHYRFVGRAAATEIYENGLCLEEYLNRSEQ